MAAVDLAAKTAPKTVELAPAVMRYRVQRPAVLGLGWRQVASAAEITAAEAAEAMSEAEVVMAVASAAAGLARLRIMAAAHAGTTASIPSCRPKGRGSGSEGPDPRTRLHTFEPVPFIPSNRFPTC